MQYGKWSDIWDVSMAVGDCILSKDRLQKKLSIKVAECLENRVGKVILGI